MSGPIVHQDKYLFEYINSFLSYKNIYDKVVADIKKNVWIGIINKKMARELTEEQQFCYELFDDDVYINPKAAGYDDMREQMAKAIILKYAKEFIEGPGWLWLTTE